MSVKEKKNEVSACCLFIFPLIICCVASRPVCRRTSRAVSLTMSSSSRRMDLSERTLTA